MIHLEKASKDKMLDRARRAAGQAQAVARMIEDERPCPEVMTQIAATRAALLSLAHVVLKGHLSSCVVEAFGRGDADESIDEIGEIIKKFVR
jgi:CsoR family transcriptional regulator, copper-sensing transcriptional repressor